MTEKAGVIKLTSAEISSLWGTYLNDCGFMFKSGAYGEDGMNLMIERSWMEQPPQFTERNKLVK